MTEEEIKKIARETARLLTHPDDFLPHKEQIYDRTEEVITVLSKDYCIVLKDAIKKLDIAYRANNYDMVILNRDDIESLFGKQIFEEDEE